MRTHACARLTFLSATALVLGAIALPGSLARANTSVSNGISADLCDKVLSVTRSGGGAGTVRSSTGGINCGATCTATYRFLTQVTLTANPDSSSAFAGWSGACTGTAPTCAVTMDQARSVTATFAPATELLLSASRVAVSVSWRSQYTAQTGQAQPLPQKNEFGFFYFSDPNNPEVFVKVLDFGQSSPYLLFYAGLTDYEYTVTFKNVQTGRTISFKKSAGTFGGGADNTALPHVTAKAVLWSQDGEEWGTLPRDLPIDRAVRETRLSRAGTHAVSDGDLDPGATAGILLESSAPVPAAGSELVLSRGAVAVSVTWRSQYTGQTGQASPLPQKDEFGFFYFSDPNNPEVFVKVLDFGEASPYLLFYAGLTDYEYMVTYRNTATGQSVSFQKPAGSYNGGADNKTLRHGGACPVAAPVLIGPASGVLATAESISFSWNPVPNAVSYDLLLDTNPSPSRTVLSGLTPPAGSTAVSCTVANLREGTNYFWRVRARGASTCTGEPLSEIRPLRTSGCQPPLQPELQGPDDKATGQSKTVSLSWAPAAGARTCNLYFGPVSPLPPDAYAPRLSSTSYQVANLQEGSEYFWRIEAVSECDETKIASSTVRSFRVGGSCVTPVGIELNYPGNNQQLSATSVALTWKAASYANYYDLYLGTSEQPALYASGVTTVQLTVSGLESGKKYFWKVVARTSCDSTRVNASSIQTFTVAPPCQAPPVPGFTLRPPSGVGKGQTYVLGWSPVDTGSGGGYIVERSKNAGFSPILDTQVVTVSFASFVAVEAGEYFHRVRAVAGCDPSKQSAPSAPVTVTVLDVRPTVIFTVEPKALVTKLGERFDNQKGEFVIENIGDREIVVNLPLAIASKVFFQFSIPGDSPSPYITLKPRQPRKVEIIYSVPAGLDVTKPQSLEALIYLTGKDAAENKLEVLPYAFVNVKVGDQDAGAAPQFIIGTDPTPVEYHSFPGYSGDSSAEPLKINIHNPGTTPMELGYEIGPELWLQTVPGWNSGPIPPGGKVEVLLRTDRQMALPGSHLPRYSYLKLRTKQGKTARLLVQDNDKSSITSSRSVLARGDLSFIVPSVERSVSTNGNTFTSRLRLSNSGNAEVKATLCFTPTQKDGFSADVRVADLLVPPADLVNLTDPLKQVFGLTGSTSGSLEVRFDQKFAGSLSATSVVEAPAKSGGTIEYRMPVARRGDGTTVGTQHDVLGITTTRDDPSALVLAETTGLDAARVSVALVDKEGQELERKEYDVPRYGTVRVERILDEFRGGAAQVAAALEIRTVSGGGAVVGVVILGSSRNDSALALVSRPSTEGAGSSLLNRLKGKPSWSVLANSTTVLVPLIENRAVQSGSGSVRSVLGFGASSSYGALFTVRYYDYGTSPVTPRETQVTLDRRKKTERSLEELFGLSSGQTSWGPVFIEVQGGGKVYAKSFTTVEGKGAVMDWLEQVAVPSESITGGTYRQGVPVVIDGLEQAIVETAPGVYSENARGKRSTLILNEVSGNDARVRVSLLEPGNRATPIAEKEFSLKAYEMRRLSTVFSELGLNDENRRKDRTGVKCVVTALEGKGSVAATVRTVDSLTTVTTSTPLNPPGGPPATGPIGF